VKLDWRFAGHVRCKEEINKMKKKLFFSKNERKIGILKCAQIFSNASKNSAHF
jgi:hypothetical protein